MRFKFQTGTTADFENTHTPGKLTLSYRHKKGGGKSCGICSSPPWCSRSRRPLTHGVPARGKVEAKLHSGAKPDFYRIYKFEQAADVARSAAAGIDRVSKVSIKATGPRFAPLFNGSEQLISITSVPSYARSVYIPAM